MLDRIHKQPPIVPNSYVRKIVVTNTDALNSNEFHSLDFSYLLTTCKNHLLNL